MAGQSEPQERGAWPHCRGCGKPIIPDGLGTALKPAVEPICLARKPLSEGSVAANVLKHGAGALNVDGCRIETAENLNSGAYAETGGRKESQSLHGNTGMNVAGKTAGRDFVQPAGRWPANVCHDGSPEVMEAFSLHGRSQTGKRGILSQDASVSNTTWGPINHRSVEYPNDSGTAARFFYSAKADAHDRWGSRHPTVKPIDLMRWLVRLVTPPGGTVLDPFAGSGTTGVACLAEDFDCILIEREDGYIVDIRERLAHYAGEGRHSIAAKARHTDAGHDDLPLWSRGSE